MDNIDEYAAFIIAKLIIILIFSVILTIQDIKRREISRKGIISAVFVLVSCQFLFGSLEDWIFLLSAVILVALYEIGRFLTQRQLGLGDVCFGFFQGLCLRPENLWICILLEVFFCCVYLLVRKLINKDFKAKEYKIPFIPFMALALIFTFVFENFDFNFFK